MAEWTVKWTGSYPCLCSGKWIVYKDSKPIDLHDCPFVEVDVDSEGNEYWDYHPANTYGIYSTWHFEDWIEVSEDYEDGLLLDAWIEEYRDWLMKIDPSGDDWENIYDAFSVEDWRYNSCMGCV